MKVFVLQHERELNGADEVKLIGIYRSREEASRAEDRTRRLPGFSAFPDGFSIDAYALDEDHWTSGFATMPSVGSAKPGKAA